MRKALTALTAAAIFTFVPGLVGKAFAHGGAYRGPAGEVPPDSRDPSDPPPPPPGGGPSTPPGDGGDGPDTGGPDVGGPDTGGPDTGGPDTGGPSPGGPDTSGPQPGGPSTGGGGPGLGKKVGKKGPGFEDWKFWWNYNKDEILQLKSELKKRQRNRTTGSDRVFGGGGTSSGDAVLGATDAAIQRDIVPALRNLLQEDDLNFDIQSAAAIALAKIGDETIVPTLQAMALNEGSGQKSYHKIVVESSALAMGLLQKDTPEIRDFLLEIVANKDMNASYVRPFAAVSLGLLGQSENPGVYDQDGKVSHQLIEIIAGKESKPDVKPAALLALGLLENESNVPALMHMVNEGRVRKGADELSDTELAFAVQALGKIGVPDVEAEDEAVVDVMKKLIDKKKGKAATNVRRSAAIALGQIAPQCSEKTQGQIIKTLKAAATKAKDSSVANFAMISMGRIGATEGIPAETRDEAVATLKFLLEKASPSSIKQPFAALALGLIGRQIRSETGTPPEEEINKVIRKKFEETSNPMERGGYAIASGLLRDPLAVPQLVEMLDDKGAEKKLRGYSAVALGMIGDSLGRDAIKRTLADSSDRELRVQTAVAAGLLGDASVIGNLVEIMEKGEESQYILGSVALALGQIGDERAITPLLAISVDEEQNYPELTRALATVALGQIGDRRDLPVLSRVAKDVNYRAHVPALAELLTIL